MDADVMAVSIEDAMRISGLGRQMIYDEINAGRLVARKAGRRTLILTSELSSYLKSLPTKESEK